jgi:acetyltransferase-like isoleucine patch superfamily enzyme/acyl carrier protein
VEQVYVAPRTLVEETLTGIFSQVLGVDEVGIHDDFFDLGGHSLLLAVLRAQVEKEFDTSFSLQTFFQAPTVAQLATILREDEPRIPPPVERERRRTRRRRVRETFWTGLRNRLFQLIALYAPGRNSTRVWLHRKRGVRIGNYVTIGQFVIIDSAYPSLVSIGNNVMVGTRSLLMAHFGGAVDNPRTRHEPSIRIEDNVHIGPGAIILPNVTIGQGAVVTAGSVVNSSIPPLTMVQGNPARPVARCGVPLRGNRYERFIRHLEPLE